MQTFLGILKTILLHFYAFKGLNKDFKWFADSIGHLCRTSFSFPLYAIFFPVPVAKSQSQCIKSHFPSAKIGKSQLPFYPFSILINITFEVPKKMSLRTLQVRGTSLKRSKYQTSQEYLDMSKPKLTFYSLYT